MLSARDAAAALLGVPRCGRAHQQPHARHARHALAAAPLRRRAAPRAYTAGAAVARGMAGLPGVLGLGRRMEELNARQPDAPPPLRVLTWNTLADGLAQHGDFVKARAAAREGASWRHRRAECGTRHLS
jgi:pentatricopeptide repeat protein